MLPGFTKLPLDLPRRGRPMPQRRVRSTAISGFAQMREWRESDSVWAAAVALRRAGLTVFRISSNYHLVDNEPIHTKTLLARASQLPKGPHGQSSEKDQHQAENQDQARS